MKLSTNFNDYEFVSPEDYEFAGDTSSRFIHRDLVKFLEAIKSFYKGAKVTVCDWKWKGQRKYSGFRNPNSPDWKYRSAHRGFAVDFIVEGVPSLKVQEDIKKNKMAFMLNGLTGIEENTDGWTHASVEWFVGHEKELAIIPANAPIYFI